MRKQQFTADKAAMSLTLGSAGSVTNYFHSFCNKLISFIIIDNFIQQTWKTAKDT